MKLSLMIWPTLMLLIVFALAGCDNGTGTDAKTGSAQLTIDWPRLQRNVPDSTESVTVVITQAGLPIDTRVINHPGERGSIRYTFPELPLGDLAYAITAYPERDGEGTPVGTANGYWHIQPATPYTMRLDAVMNSTIASLTLFPSTETIRVELLKPVQLAVEARDTEGRVVLVRYYTWEIADSFRATVEQGVLSGQLVGHTRLTVTERDSGMTISADIEVVMPSSVRVLDLPTSDMLYHAGRGIIYASTDSLVMIDPATGTVSASIPVGYAPRRLALSADESILFVGEHAAVEQIDTTTNTVEKRFALGYGSAGAYFASDFAIFPNNPRSVAIARGDAGVVIYDDGVKRTAEVPSGVSGPQTLAFSTDMPGTLYGYNSKHTEKGFYRMTVTAAGVSLIDQIPTAFSGYYAIVRFYQGRAYSPWGMVANLADGSVVGQYYRPDAKSSSDAPCIALDPAANRVYFMISTTYGTSWKLLVYNMSTYEAIASYTIPGITDTVSSMITCGQHRVACRTSGNQLILLDCDQLLASP